MNKSPTAYYQYSDGSSGVVKGNHDSGAADRKQFFSSNKVMPIKQSSSPVYDLSLSQPPKQMQLNDTELMTSEGHENMNEIRETTKQKSAHSYGNIQTAPYKGHTNNGMAQYDLKELTKSLYNMLSDGSGSDIKKLSMHFIKILSHAYNQNDKASFKCDIGDYKLEISKRQQDANEEATTDVNGGTVTQPNSGQSIIRTKVPKATLANEVKDYFVDLLLYFNVPLGGTNKKQLPWTTLTKILADHNLELVNWPEEVPFPGSKDDTSDDNKGIKGMRLEMLAKLHAAIKRETKQVGIQRIYNAVQQNEHCTMHYDNYQSIADINNHAVNFIATSLGTGYTELHNVNEFRKRYNMDATIYSYSDKPQKRGRY